VSQPPVSVYSLNRERSILQNELKAKSSKRFDTKNADEAERLAQEMRALTDRIAELEADIASAERRARETRSESQTDSGCIVGPNGGKYKITKSGKKNYGAC
jgi:crotonobetainyl-CoA:carnitine CoA-transferase CaiB-like acyl-CoA transferase